MIHTVKCSLELFVQLAVAGDRSKGLEKTKRQSEQLANTKMWTRTTILIANSFASGVGSSTKDLQLPFRTLVLGQSLFLQASLSLWANYRKNSIPAPTLPNFAVIIIIMDRHRNLHVSPPIVPGSSSPGCLVIRNRGNCHLHGFSSFWNDMSCFERLFFLNRVFKDKDGHISKGTLDVIWPFPRNTLRCHWTKQRE